jgi:hypothetical protein
VFKIINGNRIVKILNGFFFKKIITIIIENGGDNVLRGCKECIGEDSNISRIKFLGIG